MHQTRLEKNFISRRNHVCHNVKVYEQLFAGTIFNIFSEAEELKTEETGKKASKLVEIPSEASTQACSCKLRPEKGGLKFYALD